MVRVISVHHFESENVTNCFQSSAVTCVYSQNRLLIANESTQQIQVRNITTSDISHSFQSIDKVESLCYCSKGDYVAALERSNRLNSAFLRIYVNWNDPCIETASYRPRIAGAVSPSRNNELNLDIIEFPSIKGCPPITFSICSTTGNVIVAYDPNILVIYRYVIVRNDKVDYTDFKETIHVFHSFIPKEIRLSEDVIGCLSDTDVHVFKLRISTDDNVEDGQKRSMSVYSFSSEPDSSAQKDDLSLKSPLNITIKRQQDSEASHNGKLLDDSGYVGNIRRHRDYVDLNDRNRNVVLFPEVEEANKEYMSIGTLRIMADQILGPIPSSSSSSSSSITAKLVMDSTLVESEIDCITLLSCRKLDIEEAQHETFQNLRIEPIYRKDIRIRIRNDDANVLRSTSYPHLVSFTVCFTSISEGYLYHVPGHLRKRGKGCGIRRIATYPFTAPVRQIALESSIFLHALTDTGLETYTLRSGYYSIMEVENVESKQRNVCPEGNLPICLVGLRPLRNHGGLFLEIAENYVLVVDSSSISSFKVPTLIDIYRNMIQLADMNRRTSPYGYSQLISEAHIVLRTSLHRLCWENRDTNLVETTLKWYRDSCLRLANYYVLSSDSSEWILALPYYRLSEKSVSEILDKVLRVWLDYSFESECQVQSEVQSEGQGQAQGQAQGQQLLLLLLQKGQRPQPKELLLLLQNQGQRPPPPPPGLLYYITHVLLHPLSHENVLETSTMDTILDLLGTSALDTLAYLVLKSASFRSFKSNRIYDYLGHHLTSNTTLNPEKVVAYALLNGGNDSSSIEIRTLLRSVNPISLSELMIENHDLLLEKNHDSFTNFAYLIRDSVPELFVEVLVSLIRFDKLHLDPILRLFFRQLVEMDTVILQLFLETFFVEFFDDNRNDDFSDNESFINALTTLIRSYLASLSAPIRFEAKNIDSDLFGPRHLYLDSLSPFEHGGAKSTLLDAESPEFWCQNSLLKLQSLLCQCRDHSIPLSILRDPVVTFLNRYPDTVGSLSLLILCYETRDCIESLVDTDPKVLFTFGKERITAESDWNYVLELLQNRLGMTERSNHHEEWYSSLQEILHYLAQTSSLESFMNMLPVSMRGNEDYQGYIQMCRKLQQAQQLREVITNTGQEVLLTL